MRRERAQTAARLGALSEECVGAKQASSLLQKRLDAARSAQVASETQVASVRELLASTQLELQQHRQLQTELHEQAKTSESHIEAMTARCESLRDEIVELEKAKKANLKELADVSDAAQLASTATQMRAEIDASTKQREHELLGLQQIRTQHEALKLALEQASDEHSRLERELGTLRIASSQWRRLRSLSTVVVHDEAENVKRKQELSFSHPQAIRLRALSSRAVSRGAANPARSLLSEINSNGATDTTSGERTDLTEDEKRSIYIYGLVTDLRTQFESRLA
jgi:chromosome segregation ATPase